MILTNGANILASRYNGDGIENKLLIDSISSLNAYPAAFSLRLVKDAT